MNQLAGLPNCAPEGPEGAPELAGSVMLRAAARVAACCIKKGVLLVLFSLLLSPSLSLSLFFFPFSLSFCQRGREKERAASPVP